MKPAIDLEDNNISLLLIKQIDSIQNLERKQKAKTKTKTKMNKTSTQPFSSSMSLWENLGLNPGLVTY